MSEYPGYYFWKSGPDPEPKCPIVSNIAQYSCTISTYTPVKVFMIPPVIQDRITSQQERITAQQERITAKQERITAKQNRIPLKDISPMGSYTPMELIMPVDPINNFELDDFGDIVNGFIDDGDDFIDVVNDF